MTSLFDQLLTALALSLVPDQSSIDQAQCIISSLCTMEGYGPSLIHVLTTSPPYVDPTYQSIRLAAAIQLRLYCQYHWAEEGREQFVEPAVTGKDRNIIKQALPNLLADTDSKIRTAVSTIVGVVAEVEYPEEWPDLIEKLAGMISSDNMFAVQGAVRALVLIADDIQSHQLPDAFAFLSPALLRVLNSNLPAKIVMRSVTIYRLCLRSFFEEYKRCASSKEGNSDKMIDMMLVSLQDWIPCIIAILADLNVASLGIGFGLRTEAVKLVKILLASPKAIRKVIAQAFPDLVGNIWKLMFFVTGAYVSEVINGDYTQEKLYDDDGDIVGIDKCLEEMLSCFSAIAISKDSKIKNMLSSAEKLNQFVGVAIALMQISEVKIEEWMNYPNEFLGLEDDFEFSFDVRTACKTFLRDLVSAYGNDAVNAISISARAILINGNTGTFAWKLKEAAILAIGVVADDLPGLLEHLQKRAKKLV